MTQRVSINYKIITILLGSLLYASLSWSARLPDFTQLVEQASPAVVNISTSRVAAQRPTGNQFEMPGQEQLPDIFKHFFERQFPQQKSPPQGQVPEARSSGSGFLISDDGYLLTNHHVVKDADKIIVALNDRREMEAELIGSDPRSDLALLKIDGKDLPYLKMADSDKLKVGEWVLAIGSPFGFDYSVTAGIVSAIGRSLRSETYVPFIQTDVAINPGNSGGPLFNLDGEVVGINSQIYTRSGGFMGLSFAIPSNTAISVVAQLRVTGEVARGWLGVQIQEVSQDLAESFGLDKAAGALIAQVFDNSPALEAGLQAGDVITQINGNEIIMSAQVAHFIGAIAPDQSVVIQLVRDGKSIEVDVVIGHLPKNIAETLSAAEPGAYVERIGLRVVALKPEKAKAMRIRNGIDILEVDAGVAQELGLKPGDVITSMANQPISSVQQFVELAAALPIQRSISLRIVREGRPLFVAFRLNQ
ncbi:DegQ family serine endoprotease [Candidatus Njordibacter sp. Uisw_058]|uniref:DegQ family serine endoprotease n=1 Tax=Candidatus Njordibacter sp. Uisw_058 TaxID=3230974 RepID=UPI003D5A1F76